MFVEHLLKQAAGARKKKKTNSTLTGKKLEQDQAHTEGTMLQMAGWVKKAEKGREQGQKRGEEQTHALFVQTLC